MSAVFKILGVLFIGTMAASALADIYTPQEAFQDLASEPLTFVGRDYPNADLGPGGNYVCVYKNSRVYVRHEGCRPLATQRLAVFSAKIISRNGGLVEIYIENNRTDYRLEDAGPDSEGIWKLTSVNIPVILGELSFRELIQLERNVWSKTYDTCFISKSPMYPERIPETKCYGNAADPQGNLEVVWHDPFENGLREAHDLIIKAPRK
jgi:hypothetical protein